MLGQVVVRKVKRHTLALKVSWERVLDFAVSAFSCQQTFFAGICFLIAFLLLATHSAMLRPVSLSAFVHFTRSMLHVADRGLAILDSPHVFAIYASVLTGIAGPRVSSFTN